MQLVLGACHPVGVHQKFLDGQLCPCQPGGGSLAGEVTRGLSMAGSVAVIWPVSFCGQATQRNPLAIPIGWALQAVAETPYPFRSLGRDCVCLL